MEIVIGNHCITILDDFDGDGKFYAYCKALDYEDKDDNYHAIEERAIEFVKERVDENGKKIDRVLKYNP